MKVVDMMEERLKRQRLDGEKIFREFIVNFEAKIKEKEMAKKKAVKKKQHKIPTEVPAAVSRYMAAIGAKGGSRGGPAKQRAALAREAKHREERASRE
jgi:hypothetical protein